MKVIGRNDKFNETRLEVDANPTTLVKWMGEHNKAPYPVGALLFYS